MLISGSGSAAVYGLLLAAVAIVAYVFNLAKTQHGGTGLPMMHPARPPADESAYMQYYNELDDIRNVLKRPQSQSNPIINSIVPLTSGGNAALLPLNFGQPVIDPGMPTEAEQVLIQSLQPYFYDEAEIIDYYGVQHYRDQRFPGRPLRLDFAKDPVKFVKEHPEEYPSYIIMKGLP